MVEVSDVGGGSGWWRLVEVVEVGGAGGGGEWWRLMVEVLEVSKD